MGLDAVMFDLDGTLIEFQIDYKQIKNEVIHLLSETGYPLQLMENERYVLKLWASVKQYLVEQQLWVVADVDSLEQKVEDIINRVEKEAALKAQVISGMNEIVEYLFYQNIKLGIVTLNSSANAKLSLETAQLLPYFSNHNWIIGRDKTSKIKPHPEHPNTLLQEMRVNPHNVCLIGDHPTDIESANAIQCHSIALINPKYESVTYPTNFQVHRSEILPKMKNILKKMQDF